MINLKSERGLSLVEIVAGSLLVGIIVAAFFAVYINSKKIVMLAKHKMIALAWAHSEVERLKNHVRPNAGSEDYLDEDADVGYPFNISVKSRDLVNSGALISYDVVFKGDGKTAPGPVDYYAPPFRNELIEEKSGRILQSVDHNSSSTETIRQVTIQVQWDE